MKIVYFGILVFFLTQQRTNGAAVRKQPAFSRPVYSNYYLPAAMQVIFHAVDQLKHLEAEETLVSTTMSVPTTSPHAPGQHQPTSQEVQTTDSIVTDSQPSTASITSEASITFTDPTASTPLLVALIAADDVESMSQQEPSDAETPEANYATPETNHEIQESPEETAETDEESPEKTDDEIESKSLESKLGELDESAEEEEDDEIRFTLIGEKVAQVPRPSLSSYLRKTVKSPLRGSVQELATLYDALSKDARKQGLAKFSGYSDEVLRTLETTVEGGAGPQMRTLLEKAVERNELTRDDTKIKLSRTLDQLTDPASILSRDLRRLLPLRFVQ